MLGQNAANPIRDYASRIADPHIHFAPALPREKLDAALQSFARGAKREETLLLIDTTQAGGPPTGALLTHLDCYACDAGKPPLKLELKTLEHVLFSGAASLPPTSLWDRIRAHFNPVDTSYCGVYLNDQLAFTFRPTLPGEVLQSLEGLLKSIALACNRAHAVRESLSISICLACGELSIRPLLVIDETMPESISQPDIRYAPHTVLLACERCRRAQLEHRTSSGFSEYEGYSFNAADSSKLLESVKSCPDPLSAGCACPVHAALKSAHDYPPRVDRYPDPCLYDIPRLVAETVGGLPQITPRSGRVMSRFANGNNKAEGDMQTGKLAGTWTLWHENGQKKSEGAYEDDQRDGKWLHWNERGALRLEETYRKGELIDSFMNAESRIGEALDAQACLACGGGLCAVILLEREGIPPDRPGHNIVYEHVALVRCLDCGSGQLDLRNHDCFDFEELFEQGDAYAIDGASIAKLLDSVKICPDPLSETCRCGVHLSLRASKPPMLGLAGHKLDHIPRLSVEIAKGQPVIKPRSGGYTSFYPEGKKRAEVTLRDGVFTGRCTLWHPNGCKAAEGEMRNGRRHGRWIEWNDKGVITFDQELEDAPAIF